MDNESGLTNDAKEIVAVTYIRCRNCDRNFFANVTKEELQRGGGRIQKPCPYCDTENSFVSTLGETMTDKDEPFPGEDPSCPNISPFIIQGTEPRQ